MLGGALHVLGVGVGQSVLGEDGVHLGRIVARAPQHVDDLPDGVLRVVRPLGDTDDHLVAVLRSLEPFLGDEDVVGERPAFRQQEGIVSVDLQPSDEGVVGTFEDFDDLALALAVLAACKEGDAHLVVVHGVRRVAFRHEDGGAAVLGQEGVLPVALALERARHDLVGVLEFVAPFLGFADEVVGEHVLQDVQAQHLEWVGVELQFGIDALEADALGGVQLDEVGELFHKLLLGHPFAALLFFLNFLVFLSHSGRGLWHTFRTPGPSVCLPVARSVAFRACGRHVCSLRVRRPHPPFRRVRREGPQAGAGRTRCTK